MWVSVPYGSIPVYMGEMYMYSKCIKDLLKKKKVSERERELKVENFNGQG